MRAPVHFLKKNRVKGLGDLWGDAISIVEAPFTGGLSLISPAVTQATQGALNTSVQTVDQVASAVAQTVHDVVGTVAAGGGWNNVIKNLSGVVQDTSKVAVLINPNRIIVNVLEQNPITGHAFDELNKFTGGLLTTGTNVSDLVYRAMRGDAITKQELVADAVFTIQMAMVAFGGGAISAKIGGLIGTMFGNIVCKSVGNSTEKTACQLAFTVLGTASGQSLANDAAEESFTDYLSDDAQNALTKKVNQAATQIAIALCKQNQWAGPNECAILGKIGSDYLNSPSGTDWLLFLANEAGGLGASLLLMNAFPKNSPEYQTLSNAIGLTTAPTAAQVAVATATMTSQVQSMIFLGAAAAIAGIIVFAGGRK